MYKYLAWRIALIFPTVLAASMVVFVVMRTLPGDIVLVILSGSGESTVSAEAREALRYELGLNDPLALQYARWLWSMVSGEFGGHSLESRESIGSIIARQVPVTLLLASYTIVLSVLISLPMGILAAVWANRWPDYVLRFVTVSGLSLPNLWIALLAILGLLVVFRWSPPVIYTTPWSNLWNHVQMIALPVLILTWEQSSHLVRVTRSSMLEVLHEGYITTARGKGLFESSVIMRHALPNALIPCITIWGLQFGSLISGTLIMETIFGLPGIGRGLVQAALARDYPVIQSIASLLVFTSLVVNVVVDITYAIVNPRIHQNLE